MNLEEKVDQVKVHHEVVSDKGLSTSCCGHVCQGVPATWGVRLSDGFKSSGKCFKKDMNLQEISSIEQFIAVYNIETEGEGYGNGDGEYIDFTVDSGAADTVADNTTAPGCPIVPSEGSRNGVKYVAAAGKVISNEGEKNITTKTAEGHVCGIKIQIAKVNKALLSVSKICDAGHEVLFTKTGGRIIHRESGQIMNFRRVDGVYRIRVRIVSGSNSGFTRPGM